MRICFSVLPEAPTMLAPHFGETGQYVVYNSETQQVVPHACNALPCRGPCRCFVPELAGIDIVICRTIGHLVLRALRKQGTPVHQTQEIEMGAALVAWQSAILPQIERAICKTGRRTVARMPLKGQEN